MERIVDVNSSNQFKEDYLRYGVYTMYSRVDPDYRDGLKPVHRRILYASMSKSKAITNTVKSTTIIGDVMGEFHASGDSGIYSAMKTMVNWFESKLPLLEKQGSFGNFQGGAASSARYTECKLSKFAYDYVLGDLKESKECVDWTPNYKNTTLEPQYLPCAVPLLLINGTFAIGVGRKPEIPSHNVAEVIDATLALMANPNCEPILVPDHCMKCEIIDTDWRAINRAGYGYYTIRGVIDVEEYNKNHYKGKNKTALVIKSVPNLTFLDSIVDKIEDMIANKKIIQIDDMFDESTEFDMRYVIILKPGADVEYVRNTIYKNTALEQTCRINFEALDGLNPVRMSYKSYLLSFIDQRMLTKFRVYTNKLQDVQTKIHEREIFIKVLESGYIDDIIAKIRNRKSAADDKDLIEWLIKILKITPLQAQFIINIQLKKLQAGGLQAYKNEAKELNKVKDYYLSLILDENKLKQVIMDELLEIRKQYGSPRKCKIIKSNNVTDVPKGAMTVAITEKSFVKKVPFGTAIPNSRNDTIRSLINVDNSDSILIFDNMGKVFKLAVHKIPFADKGAGIDIRFLIKGLTANITEVIPSPIFENKSPVKHYLLTLSKMGYVKRMELEDFVNIPSSGLIYTKLEEGDYIQSISIPYEGMNVLVYSDKKVMCIPLSSVSIMKRNARGSKTFKSSLVDGMTILPSKNSTGYTKASLLVITEVGRFNKLPIASIPGIDTAKRQFNVIKLTRGDKIFDIHVVDETSTIMIKTLTDLHDIPVSMIPFSSTISLGEKLLNTQKDKIVRTYVK